MLPLPGGGEAVLDLGGFDDVIADDLRRGAYRHPAPLRLLLERLVPGQVVLDLGAHLGVFAVAAARRGARVLAVEGNPRSAELLAGNAERNGVASEVEVVAALVGRAEGEAPLLQNGAYSRVVDEATGAVHSLVTRVRVITVDHLLAERSLGPVDVVKLDVEGYELEALAGMADLLAADPGPEVLCESNGHLLGLAGSSPEALRAALADAGYRAWRVDDTELLELPPSTPQVVGNVDLLFARRRPVAPGFGMRVHTEHDLVGDAVAEVDNPNPSERAVLAGALAGAGSAVLADRRVEDVLARLRGDPEPAVREAVVWWSPPPTDLRGRVSSALRRIRAR